MHLAGGCAVAFARHLFEQAEDVERRIDRVRGAEADLQLATVSVARPEIEAVRAWVERGGTLVAFPGPSWTEAAAASLARLLGARVGPPGGPPPGELERRFGPELRRFSYRHVDRVGGAGVIADDLTGRARVDTPAFPAPAAMLGWPDSRRGSFADHRSAGSRVDYLLKRGAGAARRFFVALHEPVPWDSERENRMAEQLHGALEAVTGLSPTAFDEAWCRYVKQTYQRR